MQYSCFGGDGPGAASGTLIGSVIFIFSSRRYLFMSDEPFGLPESIDGVHDITVRAVNGRRYRVYLIEGTVPTLFDTGFADTAETVFEAIDEIDVRPERLVVTHQDPDHSGGFDAVAERYDVETWVPAADAEAIAENNEVEPDHRYENGDDIGRWEAVRVAGHTPGSSVLVDEATGIAVTGDVVVGSDLRGLQPGYLLPPPEIYTDYPAAAEASLETLLPYEFDTALVSHGTAVLEGASEKIERYVEFPNKPSRE